MEAKHPSHPRHHWFAITVVAIVLAGSLPQPRAHANELLGGIADIVGGVFALPMDVLAGTVQGPFLLGTVGGILRGAVHVLGSTTRGLFRLVGVAIPLAAKAAPLIPLFL